MKKSKFQEQEGITFDDVLLVPGYSTFPKEDAVIASSLHEKIHLNIPIISSPMDTVTEYEMAVAMAQNGALGIIHRNMSIENQVSIIEKVKQKQPVSPLSAIDDNNRLLVGAAISPNDSEERVEKMIECGVDLIVIDSAQGYSSLIIKNIKNIKTQFPSIPIMAGNVATYEGAQALIDAGTDILRVGIGPGSICSTRVVTGVGIPQITAILEVAKACVLTSTKIVADGGIKQTGDIAKAIACGAHGVMLGSLLASREESAGETVVQQEKKYKKTRGMGSLKAIVEGSKRYETSLSTPKKIITEGVEGLVEYQGSVHDYLHQIEGSLKSSLFYVGTENIKEFHEKAQFIKISPSSIKENHPHSITITNPGNNYALQK